MSEIKKKITDYLRQAENDPDLGKTGHLHLVGDNVRGILRDNPDYQPRNEDNAEVMAFHFVEDYPDKDSRWGDYYGPFFVLPNEDGHLVEYPSINQITPKILEYYEARAKAVRNPLMSSRYADLVVDFSGKVLRHGAGLELIKLVIDSNLSVYEQKMVSDYDRMVKIKRAMTLSIQICDSDRIENTKNAMIDLCAGAQTDHPGVWARAFECVMLAQADKINLAPDQSDRMLSSMEERLSQSKSRHYAECASRPLAEYYARHKDEDNLMRVLSEYERIMKNDKYAQSTALLKFTAHDDIRKFYQKYADKGFKRAKQSAKRLKDEIEHLDLNWHDSMRSVSVPLPSVDDSVRSLLDDVFGRERNASWHSVAEKAALYLLVRCEEIKKSFESQKTKFLYPHMSVVVISDGIVAARTKDGCDDNKIHFACHAANYIKLIDVFRCAVMNEMTTKFDCNTAFDYLKSAHLFNDKERHGHLARAIRAYWDGDYIVSSHLFVPLIENAIRTVIHSSKGTTIRPNKDGGSEWASLSQLLKGRDANGNSHADILKGIFRTDNVGKYFALVLVDPLGINLRNDFAHGLNPKAFRDPDTSHLLFHIMLWLSFVKKN